MAEVLPFKGLRYNAKLASDIEHLTAPLFDVITAKQREHLYLHPHNSIHLSTPKGEDPGSLALKKLEEWLKEGILVEEEKPAYYAYFQEFNLPGDPITYTRKGFIGMIRVYDWEEQVLLRHENTIPGAVEDRLNILEKTNLHTSPTHGLYNDPGSEIEETLDRAMTEPLYEIEDYQGVKEMLAPITHPKDVELIRRTMADKQIILADGHHRYEASLLLKKKQGGSHYHMMYFTNTRNQGLRILPTHRVIHSLNDFDLSTFFQRIEPYFTFREVDNVTDIPEIILGKPYAFGIITKNESVKVQLKPGLEKLIPWHFPEIVKQVPVTALHYYIIEKGLGIPGKHQRNSPHISFERNFTEIVRRIENGKEQLGIITQGIPISVVEDVCYSGHTLPQKSTYFYPKVIGGLVFGYDKA